MIKQTLKTLWHILTVYYLHCVEQVAMVKQCHMVIIMWHFSTLLGIQGHGVKGQGHMGSTLKILWAQYPLNGFFMKRLPLIHYQRRMNWLSTQGHEVNGQGHMGLTLKNLWVQYLLNPWTDFHETFLIDSIPKEDELIRYSRSWDQRSMSYGVNLEILWTQYLLNPWMNFSDTFTTDSLLKEDELIMLSRSWGQSRRS